ncbi:MAG: PKD domain-containing protein [Myxococcota bacterium]
MGALCGLLAAPAAADHTPLGPLEPSAHEQEGLWALNRARQDPAAYGDEIDLDLTGVLPRQPLALNINLTGSARFHAEEMLGHDYFAHTSEVTGIGPNQMAVDHGYDVFGSGLGMPWGTTNNIESIAFGQNLIADYPAALELLIIDDGVPGVGHRMHLLAIAAGWQDHSEVGFGRAATGSTRYYAIHTGYRSVADRFVTGVVYDDLDGNGRYDRGEGLPGVTVDVDGVTAVTYTEGGYSIPVDPGSYMVTCSGGAFVGEVIGLIDVSTQNVEADCIQGLPIAEIDFAFQGSGGPDVLDIAIGASATAGTAPLAVDFSATGGDAGTLFLWDFGDGGGGTGAAVSHVFDAAGLYPVLLRGLAPGGTGSDLQLIAADGPGGADPSTTPPADHSPVPTNIALQRNLKKAGKDTARLKATLEMPAGYEPGSHEIEVFVAGVALPFTLDEKGKATDLSGNKVKLKVKGAKVGEPLIAGTQGKLTVKLKGDWATALEGAGLRDADETGTLTGVPFGFLFHELAYSASADLTFKSKAGKKSKAKLVK